ncbi:MAG: FtsX-like permease family protein, partial [Caldilineaceae bacterium]
MSKHLPTGKPPQADVRPQPFARLRFVGVYLWSTARQERGLGLLALVGLGPGVAFLVAWLHLALALRQVSAIALPQGQATGWLLPPLLLNLLGLDGVLAGVGLVTLLIGCLGLANAYVASVERRSSDLSLLLALGMGRGWLRLLLLAEAGLTGLLGSAAGLLLGIPFASVVWPAAQRYLGLPAPFVLDGRALAVACLAGVLAALLFMGTTALLGVAVDPAYPLRGARARLRPSPAGANGRQPAMARSMR